MTTFVRSLLFVGMLCVLAAAAGAQSGQPFVDGQPAYSDAWGMGVAPDGADSLQVETDGVPGFTDADLTYPVPEEVELGVTNPEFRLSPTRRHLYAYGTAVGGSGTSMYLFHVPAQEGAPFEFIAGGIAFVDGIAHEGFFDDDVAGLPSLFYAVSISGSSPTQRIYWVNLDSGVAGFSNEIPPSVESPLRFAPNGIAAFLQHDGAFQGQATYRLVELCDDDLGLVLNAAGAPFDDLPSPVAQAYLTGDGVSGYEAEVWWDGSVLGVVPLDDCSSPPPPVGACCVDGDCAPGLTEADCADLGGEWQGAGSDCAGVDCPEAPVAALTIAGTGPSATGPFAPAVFSFTAGNEGALAAENVAISVTLPSNDVAFVSAGQGGIHLPSQQRVVWQLGTLAGGEQETVTLTLEANCDASQIFLGNYYVQASDLPVVQGDQPVVTVVTQPSTAPLPAFTTASVPDGQPVGTGEAIVYTVELTNDGAEPRVGLGFLANYGTYVELDAVLDDGGGAVTDEGYRFLWQGDVAAGASVQISVRLTVSPCRQGEDLQTQLNAGAPLSLFNLCGDFIHSIDPPPAITVAPSDGVTGVTATSTPAPRVVDGASFPVPTLVRPGDTVDLEWLFTNRGSQAFTLSGAACELGGLQPGDDPPFLGPPPAGTAWDPGQNRITFDGTVAPDDTVRIAFEVVYPADGACSDQVSATLATADCTVLAQASRTLVAVPAPLADGHLVSGDQWGSIARQHPDDPGMDDWLCFTGEAFWDVAANADGSFWLSGLPSYRIDPDALTLTALGQPFADEVGLANIRHVAEDTASGLVYVAGNRFHQGQSYLSLRSWDPDTDARAVVYDEMPGVPPRLGDPRAMVLDQDGRLAIGTGWGVFRIDPADPAGAVLWSDPLLPFGATNLAVLPGGRYVVAHQVFGSDPEPLVAIDPADGAHSVLVSDLNDWPGHPTIPYVAAAADDSNRVFLAPQEGAVTVVDLDQQPPAVSALAGSDRTHTMLAWRGGAGGIGTAAPDPPPARITELVLHGPAPNPFNPRTTVRFDLPRPGHARLALYDLRGRRVTTLVDRALPAGAHAVAWRGRDAAGRVAPSGLYVARLVIGGEVRTAKLLLAR